MKFEISNRFSGAVQLTFEADSLKAGIEINKADLCGASLRGANLRGANLRGAYLCEANLYGVDLYGAKRDSM